MHQPATSFGLMLAPCHCGELNPMWLLVPCPLLEATPCHQTSSPVRLLWDLQERGGLGSEQSTLQDKVPILPLRVLLPLELCGIIC